MSTVEMRRDLLEMQKLIQDIETELARRHNWGEQERFWAHETKMSRGRNYIALAAIVATITAAAMAGMLTILTKFL